MIQARPKISTLFSISIFLIIAYAVFFYTLLGQNGSYGIWSLIIIFSSGPIAIAVTLKTFWGVKLINITKEKFTIKYPFRFSERVFSGKDLDSWKLDKIKTYGGEYEELIWITKSGKKYSISKQEHTEYDKALNYTIKKFKRLKK